jgi:hypothetical protein
MLLPPGHDAWSVGTSLACSSNFPEGMTITPATTVTEGLAAQQAGTKRRS